VVTPVVSYVTSGVWSDGAYLDPTWDEEALAAARSYVDGVGARVAERVPLVSGEAVIGTPVADTIVARATALGCDLVLMSSHALTGVGRALLGSVADAVVRKADCPVLVILATDRAATEDVNSPLEVAAAAPATI
jgi:nucleotide-binding universal stress UspA family protein